MEHILSWNTDNYYNEECISAKKEDKWVFKSSKNVEDGMLLFHIHKSCLFNGRNCTVATLLDKSEDRRLTLTIGFIYEMFVFGAKESQWYDYLYPLLNGYNSQSLEITPEDEELVTQWEEKFNKYYDDIKKEFGWSLIDTKSFDFRSIAAFILSSIVMIDIWLGPCLLPGGIMPSKTCLKDCNVTLVTVEDVCSLCGEEICGCKDMDGEESGEDEESESEEDQSSSEEEEDKEDEEDGGSENEGEDDQEEKREVMKPCCVTIVAGSDNVEGGVDPLEANCKLKINVMDISEMQYSSLFEMEEEEEEQSDWFDEEGKPLDWLLYQLDPYSKLSDKQLHTKIRHLILYKINELQKNDVPKNNDTYINLRKALKHSYIDE